MNNLISFVAGFAAGITYATGKEQPYKELWDDLCTKSKQARSAYRRWRKHSSNKEERTNTVAAD